ncbi:hypothetical protein JBKA6_0620 [Ichthyobacterium seriolicida]|uniref:Uncharacterized protein n=1 Tax=Ichthyobacterium seriolicida TaxID=242600 RepID=A0A1J1DXR6_9FLAO|nr:hypothetical protein JBKA6_0620 [Ichthyobacterium seriolicida]
MIGKKNNNYLNTIAFKVLAIRLILLSTPKDRKQNILAKIIVII